jgi:hypothetical protein
MNRRKIIVISVVLAIAVAIFATIQFINWKYDEYTIHGNPKFDLALLDVDKKFKDYPTNYPPDPGKEGDDTLLGIDTDKDGVRDDVQRWIFARFHETPLRLKAMRKRFVEIQSQLQQTWEDREDCMRHDKAFKSSEACWYAAFPIDFNAVHFKSSDELLLIEAKVLNTYDRIRKYLINDRKCSGGVFDGIPARPQACDE